MGINRKQIIGKWGETMARRTLEAKGYQVIGSNVRSRYGEIDLIAKVEDEIVFVEVKTRSGSSFGFPEDSITKQKYLHLEESALSYMQEHPELQGDWRIDVIAIEGKPDRPNPKITWFKNVLN
jgi:putative endonuclease